MEPQWKIFLLMDHREFKNSTTNFAPRAKQKIDRHFFGSHPLDAHDNCSHYCETAALISGDYMFVARLLDGSGGAALDERVLDLVVERKSVDDLQSCLINKSKQYPPLSFFEAQMYKLQQTPGLNKIFLMEGDEDRTGDISVASNPEEWVLRRKRVKTMRNQIGGNEWSGVELVCTTDKNHSVQYLVDRMAEFIQEGFDASRLNLYRTMQEYKQIVNDRMKDNTFVEYLRLRRIKGTGDVKAMKVIRDPNGPWDKDFQSPACTAKDKGYKSTLDDRAVYYDSNNIGGMSKMGNMILDSQSSPMSATTTNSIRTNRNRKQTTTHPSLLQEKNSSSNQSLCSNLASKTMSKSSECTTLKASTQATCKKCQREVMSGRKDNSRYDVDCARRKSQNQKTIACNSSISDKISNFEADESSSSLRKGNDVASSTDDAVSCKQFDNIQHSAKKKRLKPTESIYYNPNPLKRKSIFTSDIDHHLIASIQTTRPDLTGGSGLGLAGFELSHSRGRTATVSGDGVATARSRSYRKEMESLNRSSTLSMSQEIRVSHKNGTVGSVAGNGIENCYSPDVIVLDESDDEIQLVEIPPADLTSSTMPLRQHVLEVEVIEID